MCISDINYNPDLISKLFILFSLFQIFYKMYKNIIRQVSLLEIGLTVTMQSHVCLV